MAILGKFGEHYGAISVVQATDGDNSKSLKNRSKRIGKHLRELYDEVANEPVPDEFLKILEEADKKKDGDEGSNA